ncbi:O-acyltransferase WSD1-like [Senna tora]|uniref:O-acyltransferase WSD1-like n=1 Tax=Senna tora TaxID=362788 RepID=A0A834TEU4_9FABA|nr:O-acyltransferase WSD1-like [Senna tora]
MKEMAMEYDPEAVQVPVSPVGQYFNSSVLQIYIIGVLEFEVPLDHSQAIPLLTQLFLPINPRFSSIVVEDKRGDKQWKKVEVKLKDHINIPIFPEFKTQESYDNYFGDYLSRIALEQLPQSRPLWEIHIINYPTTNATSSLIFKLHHALGDGYSLMGALLSCLQRADDPSLPLTFPSLKKSSSKSSNKSFLDRFSWVMSSAYNTIEDLGWSILKSSVMEDDETPIRCGNNEGYETRPFRISTMEFSIDHIKLIKSRLGVTINDVITGIIFYGIRLYMEDINYKSRASNSTALVLLNTRNAQGYESVNEMLNAKAKGPWGNRIAFLHVPIPKLKERCPLEFIWEAHNIIKRKKQSLAVPLTGMLLEMESKFRGYEAVAKHIQGTLTKSSAVITNLIGPTQQMSLANHPVKGLYFTLAGGPESLVISIMSYMGVLRVTLKTQRYFIDEHKLKCCIKNAFEIMLKAAMEIPQQSKTSN